MKDIKGAIMDKRLTLIWKMIIVGGSLMVLVALSSWPWEFIRKRRRAAKLGPNPTARDRALKALREASEECFNYEDHRKRLFFEINKILRDFLKDVYGLDTANRPSIKIVNQLKDLPFYEELKELVERINKVVYGGEAPVDVESIMRQFSDLVQRIDGTNHGKAG